MVDICQMFADYAKSVAHILHGAHVFACTYLLLIILLQNP